MGKININQNLLYSASGALDPRFIVDSVDKIENISNAYVGLEVYVVNSENNIVGKYKIKKINNLTKKPLPANEGGYELIQEPKDLKYSDDTSFLNSDNEIDIDTLKLKNIPELLPVPMLDGFYYTISNNTPWEGQILTNPVVYHIVETYVDSSTRYGNLEIIMPLQLSQQVVNFGTFSLSLINNYPDILSGDKQFEISIFNINKCSNGYLSSNSSYKFKIPLNVTSNKTSIKTEDGINLECGIGSFETNYKLIITLPENEPNISDYRVVLSFSNIQDVSGKIDKISNSTNGNLPKLNSEGNLVDSGISADSILTKVTGTNLNGKLATLDANGNITNSGKSLSDLRAELDNEYVPKPSTDPSDGQILSYDETNETTKWIDNTKVHIKYAASVIPTESLMHNSIQPGDLYIGIYSDNNSSDSTTYTDYEWSKIVGIDGKSAYQQWREAGYTGDETDFLNSLKAHIAGFKSVSYDANAPITIGSTANAINGFSASVDTTDKIVLMPNSDNTATIMYTTTATENGGVTTYAFSCIGELALDTSDFLNTSSMDSTNLKNPTALQVAKATDVMPLAAKLEGVTAVEDKRNVIDETTGHINFDNTTGSTSSYKWGKFDVQGYKRVRFKGYIRGNGYSAVGFCFVDANDNWIDGAAYDFDSSAQTSVQKEYVVNVPQGAVYFKTNTVAGVNMLAVDFYCYGVKGENILDKIQPIKETVETINPWFNGLDSAIETRTEKSGVPSSDIADNMYVSSNGVVTFYTGSQCAIIDVREAVYIKVLGWNLSPTSSVDRGFVFVKNINSSKGSNLYGGTTVQVIPWLKTGNSSNYEYTLEIPEGATHLKCNIKINNSYTLPAFYYILGRHNTLQEEFDKNKPNVIDSLTSESTTDPLSANQGRVLNEKMGITIEVTEDLSTVMQHELYLTNMYLDANSSSIGKNISDVPRASYNNTNVYKIDIGNYTKITFRVYQSSQGYGSLITDENGVVLSCYTASAAYITTIDVPNNAKYLYYTVSTSISAYTFGYKYQINRFDYLQEQIDSLAVFNNRSTQAVNSTTIKPILLQGLISNGNLNADDYYVTTTPIFGNFYMELNSPYKVFSAALVRLDGTIVADKYLSDIYSSGTNTWNDVSRSCYGVMNMPSEYGVMVTIVKRISSNTKSTLTPTEAIIKKFEFITDTNFIRVVPDTNFENYYAAWRRSRLVQKIIFTPLKKIPARGSLTTNFYKKGATYLGVPYSGARYHDKFVGVDVAIRTYLSALANSHSLMYTENLTSGTSGYSISYPTGDTEACSYYGFVCSAFVAYVLGQDIVWPSNRPNKIPGLTMVSTSNNYEDYIPQPLDVIVTEGHISIVSDVLKDTAGNIKYICWAEAVSPLIKITPYTKDRFVAIFNANKGVYDSSTNPCGIYRLNTFANIPTIVEDNTNLVEIDSDDYVLGRSFNEDICTFAGDYAAFREGQTIYLNIKPSNVYTKIVVHKDETETTSDIIIDISSEAVGNDGIADINISSYNLEDGIYTATLSNNDNSVVSEPTHFEILKAELTITPSGTSDDCSAAFDYGHGTPFAIVRCDSRGVLYANFPLDGTSLISKTVTVTKSTSNNNFKMYVKGDYGIVRSIMRSV